ncbi:MAG: O-antigen ligase family protein [Myxococcota bacterium]|nr:O-antigen ligase family protein [Myxococcota bacterium]
MDRSPLSTRPSTWLALFTLLIALLYLPGLGSWGAARQFLLCAGVPVLLLTTLWLRPLRFTRAQLALMLPWALLAGLAISRAPFLPHPGWALDNALWVCALSCALALGIALARDQDTSASAAHPIQWALCAAALGLSSFSVLEASSVSAGFGNPDLLAAFLSLSVPWLLSAMLHPEHRRLRLVAAAGLLMSGLALLRLESLGALLAALLGVAWLLGAHWRSRLRWLVALGILAALLASTQLQLVKEHLESRRFMAEVSLSIVESEPLGVGPGHFAPAWMEAQAHYFSVPEQKRQKRFWTRAAHAHNELLHVAAEQGVAAVPLLLAPFLILLFSRRQAPLSKAVALAALSLAMFSLPLYEPASAFLVAFSLGWGWSGQATTSAPEGRRLRLLGLALLALVCVGLASTQLLSKRLLVLGADREDPELLALASTLSLRPERAQLHRAELLLATDPLSASTLAQVTAQAEPSPLSWALAGRCSLAADAIPDAIAAFEESVRLHPWFFAGYFNLSVLWKIQGDWEQSRRYAMRARSLAPEDYRLRSLPD